MLEMLVHYYHLALYTSLKFLGGWAGSVGSGRCNRNKCLAHRSHDLYPGPSGEWQQHFQLISIHLAWWKISPLLSNDDNNYVIQQKWCLGWKLKEDWRKCGTESDAKFAADLWFSCLYTAAVADSEVWQFYRPSGGLTQVPHSTGVWCFSLYPWCTEHILHVVLQYAHYLMVNEIIIIINIYRYSSKSLPVLWLVTFKGLF